MKWCCVAFEGWFEQAGSRGVAVVIEKSPTAGPSFFIQHRSVAIGDEGPKDYPRPLTLASEVGILFCPWCGVDLAKCYRRHIDTMERPEFILRS